MLALRGGRGEFIGQCGRNKFVQKNSNEGKARVKRMRMQSTTDEDTDTNTESISPPNGESTGTPAAPAAGPSTSVEVQQTESDDQRSMSDTIPANSEMSRSSSQKSRRFNRTRSDSAESGFSKLKQSNRRKKGKDVEETESLLN